MCSGNEPFVCDKSVHKVGPINYLQSSSNTIVKITRARYTIATPTTKTMSEAVSPQADKHSDRPYDEAVDVSGDEASTPGSSPNPTSGEAGPADALGGAAASPAAEFGEGEHQAGTDDSPVGGDGTTPQIGGGATGSGASGGRSQASSSPGKSSPSQSPSPVAAKKMGGKLEGLGDSGKKSECLASDPLPDIYSYVFNLNVVERPDFAKFNHTKKLFLRLPRFTQGQAVTRGQGVRRQEQRRR